MLILKPAGYILKQDKIHSLDPLKLLMDSEIHTVIRNNIQILAACEQ